MMARSMRTIETWLVIVNDLHTATSEGRWHEVIEKTIGQVILYTREHLVREEQIMALIHFPNINQHKIGHEKFARQLAELQQKYQMGSITVASQLSTVLRDWLSLHIRRSDKEIETFLQKQSKGQLKFPTRHVSW